MSVFELVFTYGLGTIALLASLVSVIVELTKSIGFLKRVPTAAYVVVISLAVTLAAYFAIIDANNTAFAWYEIVLTIFASFVVAYVAMYGWSRLHEVWQRFKK